MIKSVCDHVRHFQPVESHYVRSRNSKLYLDESLSYSRMFALYKNWLAEPVSNCSNPAKTLRQYQDIVNKKFNLGFRLPRKDQCDICHFYKNLPKPFSETELKTYNEHIRNKEIARELKIKFKKLSETDSAKTLLTISKKFMGCHMVKLVSYIIKESCPCIILRFTVLVRKRARVIFGMKQ